VICKLAYEEQCAA